MEEGNIGRDRIVNEHLVDEDYFCTICCCLLWKPCACSKCHHHFCQNCIHTWLENPNNSGERCPLCRQPFEEEPCSSQIYSTLDRLKIYCRNSKFGCKHVRSYNSLESHETISCKYLSEQCSECDQLILISKRDEHYETPGLCTPHPVKCTSCQTYIEKPLFKDHFWECFENRIGEIFGETLETNNIQTITNDEQVARPIWLQAFHNGLNILNFLEEQRQYSPIPTNLIGVDVVRQAREQQCGFFYHIFMVLRFLLANISKAPAFILILSGVGLVQLTTGIFFIYWKLVVRAGVHINRGCCFIMLFSYVLIYGILLLFRFVSDSLIISLFVLITFFLGCSNRHLPLELYEFSPEIYSTKLKIAFYCGVLLIMKILLLFCRFYCWCIPTYVTAGCVAWINFFLAYHTKRPHQNNTPSPIVQTITTT
ncbi:unnamed protein product [Adineta steineri]|uniref:RING-type domain-containing protein n=1 Tax=Adineta steineri TaxID=433720 RepID=A0A814T442_9BILA|nr:unnamed protein product [Adineta steineri]CAF1185069.1 unnamed protein product [Adineta steineri]